MNRLLLVKCLALAISFLSTNALYVNPTLTVKGNFNVEGNDGPGNIHATGILGANEISVATINAAGRISGVGISSADTITASGTVTGSTFVFKGATQDVNSPTDGYWILPGTSADGPAAYDEILNGPEAVSFFWPDSC